MLSAARITSLLQQYHQIEKIGKTASHQYYQYLLSRDENLLTHLMAAGIPVFSAVSFVTKLITDVCELIHLLIRSLKEKRYAGGNVQTMVVDTFEYVRNLLGCILGLPWGLWSPHQAAKNFLIESDNTTDTKLTSEQGAKLYAMANVLHAFFKRHGIDYRMCSGTALGALREKGIIPKDDDVDLMVHPDSVDKLKRLIDDGTLERETGISIGFQPETGGWQCFYDDSPKGAPDTALSHIGVPFVDIFPGTWRPVNNQQVITYGLDQMHYLSLGDYFTESEWGEPVLYPFGPTHLYGIQALSDYVARSYGHMAEHFITRLYSHETYAAIWAEPKRLFELLTQKPLPRYMCHTKPSPLGFVAEEYQDKCARVHKTIFVDGVFDLFHQGHRNIILNAIKKTQQKYPGASITVLVGICHEGVDKYKRKTVLTLPNREALIADFIAGLVTDEPQVTIKVLPNTPITPTMEFAKEHGIDIFFHGNDFTEDKIAQYYGDIQKHCELETLPYTEGVSTTKFIVDIWRRGLSAFFPAFARDNLATREQLVKDIQSRDLEDLGISPQKYFSHL